MKQRLAKVERSVQESAEAIAAGLKSIQALTRQHLSPQALNGGSGCDTIHIDEPARTTSLRAGAGGMPQQASTNGYHMLDPTKMVSSSFTGKYGCHRKQRQKPRFNRATNGASAAGGSIRSAAGTTSTTCSEPSAHLTPTEPISRDDPHSVLQEDQEQQDLKESREDLREESRAAREHGLPKSSPFDA